MNHYKELEDKVISWINLKSASLNLKNYIYLEAIEILMKIAIKILFILSKEESKNG